jgi:hypothetical protein
MFLTIADPAPPGERAEQKLVDARVERRELQPRLQVAECLGIGTLLTRCSSRAV